MVGALIAWAVMEAYLRFRTRASRGTVEWSFFAMLGGIGGGIVAGLALDRVGAAVIGAGWWAIALGIAVLVAGAAFRAWAAVELGRFFKVTVSIQIDHRVVDTGPYRVLRHPSYTGLLLVLIGLGIALDNWLSLLALFAVPLVAVLLRIRAEEGVLSRALGESYRAYAARTARLIPGVW